MMQTIMTEQGAEQVRSHPAGAGSIQNCVKHTALVAHLQHWACEHIVEISARLHQFTERANLTIYLLDLTVLDGDVGEGFCVSTGNRNHAHFLTSPRSSMNLFTNRVLSSGRISRRMIPSASATDCSATKARNSLRAAFMPPSISRWA